MIWQNVINLGPFTLPFWLLPAGLGISLFWVFTKNLPDELARTRSDLIFYPLIGGILGGKISLLIQSPEIVFENPESLLFHPGYLWGQVILGLAGVGVFFLLHHEKQWKPHLKTMTLGLGSGAAAAGLVFVLGLFFSPMEILDAPPDIEHRDGSLYSWSADPSPVRILNFWATWCAPCVAEIPEIGQYSQSPGSIPVLGVNATDTEPRGADAVEEFAESVSIDFPVILDRGSRWLEHFTITSFPTTLLVSRDGRVLERKVGVVTKEMLQSWESHAERQN